MPELSTGEYIHPLNAITKVSQLAGRVIDRNQGVAEQSFAWALQLDQELEDLWKELDPAWLDYSELQADPESNAAELRERLLSQICFHQIRVYLHLPFMLKSASNSRFTYSRTACLNGSREVLRLYQALRTGAVQPLYECKAIDFIGFTAAVLIQIGLLNFGTSAQNSNPKDIESDIRLIEISIDIFRRASSEKGGKVALQSAQVLEKMMTKYKGGHDECASASEFIIPYFGTISIQRGGQEVKPTQVPRPPGRSPSVRSSSTHNAPLYTPSSEHTTSNSDLFSPHAPTQSLNLTPKTSISSATNPSSSAFTFANNAATTTTDPSPFATYNGFYNWDNLNADDNGGTQTLVNDDSMNNFPLPTNNFSWQHMPMDIDQDWSWFLNDSQTQGAQNIGAVQQGGGRGGAGSVPMDVFSAQGFTGFG
jgi:hypothetical protein